MKKLFLLSIFSCTMLATAQTAATDEGVEINGVIWATRNVATPNTFVGNPEDLGNYYTWNVAQSIHPVGWRIPTKEELQTLLDDSNVIRIWDNTKKGYTYTDAVSGESIFLPAAGLNTSVLEYVGESGYYWSSSEVGGSGYSLAFSNVYRGNVDIFSMGFGMSVRCVKADSPVTSLTNIGNKEIKIYTRPHTIIVENADGKINIHNTTGEFIAGRDGARPVCEIPVPTAGIYIVRVGNHIQKVIVP